MRCHHKLMTIMLLAVFPAAGCLCGAVRSSTNYVMETDTYDGGGGMMGTLSYSTDATVGGGTALGSPVSAGFDLPSGMVAQLYEFVGITVTAQFGSVNETQANQLYATALAGDGSLLPGLASVTTWGVVTGPILNISAAGLATTDFVLNDTGATAGGTWLGLNDTVTFGVLDSNPDNYYGYGGDGLPDNWQVHYFGLPPNADAHPTANPDGDPDPNEDEWMTGHDPNDPADFFRFIITGRSGTTATFEVDKTIFGRKYTLEYTTDFTTSPPGWTFVTEETPGNQTDYTFEDTSSTDERDFYHMRVELVP